VNCEGVSHGLNGVGVLFGFFFAQTLESSNMDVTSALTAFGQIETAVPLVGAAFLGVLGLMAAFKLARGLFA
jgi:hypothetical protein